MSNRVSRPAPVKKMPLHIGDDRMLGGIDLTATLQAGRPVHAAARSSTPSLSYSTVTVNVPEWESAPEVAVMVTV